MPDIHAHRDSDVGRAVILRGDARQVPLSDDSVDLIVTSPPYYGQRAYTDGGKMYAGQLGAEPTPREYIDNLIACTAEWMRVLKPSGSIFVNLGDKYAGSPSGPRRLDEDGWARDRSYAATRLSRIDAGTPQKSLMLLPERYRIACIDHLGLIARAVLLWDKPNGLPESVTDRVRRSHEDWVHLVKRPTYFAAVDEIREPHVRTERPNEVLQLPGGGMVGQRKIPGRVDEPVGKVRTFHPLGRLPGSVWSIATEPLDVPESLGVDHFAAMPTEWPRRLILGWSPRGICTQCHEPRRLVVDRNRVADRPGRVQKRAVDAIVGAHGPDGRAGSRYTSTATITGEACACTDMSMHTRRAVVLDPFGGTGTTALVAKALGRIGISIDRSADYCRLAQWRTNDPRQLAKAARKPLPPKPLSEGVGQLDLFGVFGEAS